jgi:hypothetical protein
MKSKLFNINTKRNNITTKTLSRIDINIIIHKEFNFLQVSTQRSYQIQNFI